MIKTMANIAVAAVTAFMGAVLLGGEPLSHPVGYAAATGVLWLLFDSIGGVPSAEVRGKEL